MRLRGSWPLPLSLRELDPDAIAPPKSTVSAKARRFDRDQHRWCDKPPAFRRELRVPPALMAFVADARSIRATTANRLQVDFSINFGYSPITTRVSRKRCMRSVTPDDHQRPVKNLALAVVCGETGQPMRRPRDECSKNWHGAGKIEGYPQLLPCSPLTCGGVRAVDTPKESRQDGAARPETRRQLTDRTQPEPFKHGKS